MEQGRVSQPDYSGLQVAPTHAAPEVDHSHSLPQVVFDNNQKVVYAQPYAQAPLEPYNKAGAEDAPQPVINVNQDPEAVKSPAQDHRPWWKLKRWITAIVIIVLIVVGAITGAVIATR